MARKSHLITKRDTLIYNEYAAQWALGIRESIIIKNLSDKFFLAESTVYRIILAQTKTEKATKEVV